APGPPHAVGPGPLRRRGGPPPRRRRELPPLLEGRRRTAGRRGRLPRPRQPQPRRRGVAPPPRRGLPPQGGARPPKKSRRLLRQPAELTFRFIAEHRGEVPVAWACGALEVSESGYHAWAARPASPSALRREGLVAVIELVHAEVKGRYGSPRM